jgi:hypothetical protein
MDRYALFGVIAKEREVNEPMDYEDQNIADSGETLIYETDDFEEAKAIYEAGGFERDGKWNVVTRYEDRNKAAGTGAGPVRSSSALNKDDFA